MVSERVLSGQGPLLLLELNHQRLKLISLLVPKVNLKLNLNILVMLNVSGVRDMDVMHYASECSNKTIMMIKDNGDIESESDRSDCKGMPPLEVS